MFFLFGMTPTQLWAQNVISVEANAMRENDKITYRSMCFSTPGEIGENCLWDFTNVDKLEEKYNIQYTRDGSLNGIHQHIGQGINSFVFKDGYCNQYMHENRLAKIIYFNKKMVMKYPLAYGDSISSNFEGYGQYCGNHLIKVKGQVLIHADGKGNLTLPDGYVLNNVLRVYTVTTTSMGMNADYAETNSTKKQQEIEEKYEWYCEGFRYPVYAIIQKTSFTNLEQVGSTQCAYQLLSEDFDCLNGTDTEGITTNVIPVSQTALDIFQYNVKINDGKINIYYSADTDACVRTIVSDVQGLIYAQQLCTVKGGKTGYIHVSTSGLHSGLYILYINVNGKISSRTISIK